MSYNEFILCCITTSHMICYRKWEGNPLYCDCNALPLWNHLNNLGSDHSPITCFAPADVTGMDLYYVQKFHLRCGNGGCF